MQNNIQNFRKNKKISRAKLAKKINTTGTTIYRLERGERQLTLDWLQRIAVGLKCYPSELLNKEWIKPEQMDEERMAWLARVVEESAAVAETKLTPEQFARVLTVFYNDKDFHPNNNSVSEIERAIKLNLH